MRVIELKLEVVGTMFEDLDSLKSKECFLMGLKDFKLDLDH